jgi:hypothetical protein
MANATPIHLAGALFSSLSFFTDSAQHSGSVPHDESTFRLQIVSFTAKRADT